MERFAAAVNAGDIDGAVATMTPDVVGDWTNSISPYTGMRQGHADARTFFEGFWEAFDDMRWIYEPPDELPDGRLMLGTRVLGKGRSSGVDIDARGAVVVDFQGELISWIKLFQSLDDARLYVRRERLASARLYFVCEGRPAGGDPEPLLDAALRGGVDLIQLREEAPRCAEELVALSEPFRRAADEHGALFFINDQPELVEACRADGVHVGQDDAPVADARAAAGPTALVGLSTHSAEQFDAALAAEGDARPDQISAGPVWETPTKKGRPAAGLGLIEHAAAHGGEAPWFAIGGIDTGNIGEVVVAGARRAVVVRAIRDAQDPEAAARSLREALDG